MSDDIQSYDKPSVTVDNVIFTFKDGSLKVLLIKRDLDPFKGEWAFPGGFVRIPESLDEAARRELVEEAGVSDVYLEQLYTFGDPDRDPRGRVITVTYMALVNSQAVELQANTDASDAEWCPAKDAPSLAFDHDDILDYALQRLQWKFEYTTVAFSFLPKQFTMSELRETYEAVFDRDFDRRNFAKKIKDLDIIEAVGKRTNVPHRPPTLYELKTDIGEIVPIL